MRSRPLSPRFRAHFRFGEVLVLLEGGKHACIFPTVDMPTTCGRPACARAVTEDRAFPFDDKALTSP